MKKWSQQAWEVAAPTYNKILELPFIKELTDGSLSRERFLFYIRQDSLYIAEYFRVLANIASRLGRNDHAASFIAFAADGVAVEKALHEVYLHGEKLENMQMSTACNLYTSWLKSHSYAPVEVAAAAILPCFWVYKEVGETIYRSQTGSGNPYKAWIDCYGDPTFEESNKLAISICDDLAEAATPEIRRAMTDAFVEATNMEWLFWHTAYNMNLWGL